MCVRVRAWIRCARMRTRSHTEVGEVAAQLQLELERLDACGLVHLTQQAPRRREAPLRLVRLVAKDKLQARAPVVLGLRCAVHVARRSGVSALLNEDQAQQAQ